MGTASANLTKLATFVSTAGDILGGGDAGLRQRITALRANYDSFQANQSAQFRVANVDLMGAPGVAGDVSRYLGALEQDRWFVEVTREAFERASGSGDGLVTVDEMQLEAVWLASVRAVEREYNVTLDPAELWMRRAPITVNSPDIGVVPQTSGFVMDPICTATGHFLEVEEDFVWPERLAILRWRRGYSSRFMAEGPFGRGWASWASVGLLAEPGGTVGYQGPDGELAVFFPEAEGQGYGRVSAVAATLAPRWSADGSGNGSDDGPSAGLEGWDLVWDWHSPHPGETWRFGLTGRLISVSGLAAGVTRFEHAGDRLVAVEHDSGRRLELDWDGARVVAIRSSCGRQARYLYNEAGDLVRTERMLGDRDYVVDEQGRIVEVRDADGVRLCRNTYDDEGRVLTQVSPFGRETVLAYHPGYRTVVSDSDDGPVAIYEHDAAGRLVGLIDHDGHRMERSFDAEGRLVAMTGFDGATVRESFESDGRSASQVGADGVVQRWDYDDQRRVVRHTAEGGASVSFDYAGDDAVPARMVGPNGWELQLDVVDGLLRSLTDADGVRAGFEYDADGNVVAITNGVGAVTRIEPHVSGEAARLVAPDGAVFEFDRDDAGRLLAVRTPVGDEFRMEWTRAGRPTALVEPNGARMAFESGSHGEIQRVVDALGRVLELQHDQLARLVGLAAPGGAKWGFEYTALGLLSMVTDPSGAVWEYGYDAEGRMTSATDPMGHQVRQRYNPAGRLVELVDRSGNATRFNHDALGRVVGETDPEGAVTAYEWDTWGRPTRVRLPDGESLAYTYTPAGRVATVQTAEGRGWSNRYDAAGRLVAVTDAADRTTQFEWDASDRLTAVITPSGRTDRYRYDGCGRVVEAERAGRVWRTDFDHAGRVMASIDPLGNTTRYDYDLAGKLVAATDPRGSTVRIRYDDRGNPSALVDPFGRVVTTTYDPMRRPVAVTDQLGRTTRIVRDAAGRPAREELPTGDLIEWRRDARGAALDVRLNGRDVVVFERDRTGRPVLVHEPARNRTFTLAWTAGGRLRSLDVDGALMHWSYDPDGLLAERVDAGGRRTRYTHDRSGRLTALDYEGWGRIDLARHADGRLIGLRAPGFERSWDHDAGGLVVATRTSSPDGEETVELVRDEAGRVTEKRGPDDLTRYRYDAAGQLVAASRGSDAWEWHYDPAGRLAHEVSPTGERRFVYDDAHQLVHVDSPQGRTSYSYDACGRRIAETGPAGSRRYHWDGLGRLQDIETDGQHRELDVDALGQLAAVDGVPLTWDLTMPVPELVTLGGAAVLSAEAQVLGLAGALPTATSWLDGDGRDPWGHGAGAAGEAPSLGYLGEVDIDGLVWLRNRVYDPDTRQFLSPDPLPGVPGLPVAANPYHYANNNPLGFVDPLGLTPLSIDAYNQYREQNTGWKWNNIVTVGLVVAGVATMFIPGLNLAGAALIGVALGAAGGAAPGLIQGFQTGHFDWGAIGGGALKGAVIGGLSFGAARGFSGLGSGFGTLPGRFGTQVFTSGTRSSAALRGGLLGTGEGFVTGTAGEVYDVLPLPGSDGQFDPEGIAISTVLGGGTGAGGGAALYRPGPTAGDVNFTAPGDRYGANMNNRADVDPNGTYDVVAHGSPTHIQVQTQRGPQLVDHRVAARLIEAQPDYTPGQDVRLLSCWTGSTPDGFAQNLANKMNVTVRAATSKTWAWPNGQHAVGPTPTNLSGKWVDFTPQRQPPAP